MNVFTVASKKGGVTKTTTAASIAYYLGERAATLLVDFDPQGQVSLWFGKDPESGVFDWWTKRKSLTNATVAAREEGHLWLLPGNSLTEQIEQAHRKVTSHDFKQFVARVRYLGEFFEYIVIDTAPSGVLQQVAVASADFVVVPFRAEVPGVDGAHGTLAMLKAIPHQARVVLLPADFYGRVSEQKRCLAEFVAFMGPRMMAPQPVVHRTAVTEAVAEGKTVFEYDGNGLQPVREAYRQLVDSLIGEVKPAPEYPEHLYDLAGKPHDARY